MRKIYMRIYAAAVCTALLIALAGTVFAYFYTSNESDEKTMELSGNATSAKIAIDNYDALFLNSKDTVYNGGDDVSASSGRKTLVFSGDITLLDDLVITADCHIDLGGYKLIMNGHSLTFRHTYYGSFRFYNGEVVIPKIEGTVDTTCKIYVDTKNAVYAFDNVTFIDSENTVLSASDYETIISINYKYIAYNALYSVAGALVNQAAQKKEPLDYGDVSDLSVSGTGTDESPYRFYSPTFLNIIEDGCILPCAYVFRDLDLPRSYYGYDYVTIEYSSSDTAIISDYGNVTAQNVTVILSAYVKINGTSIASCDFTLHVVNASDTAKMQEISDVLLKTYLAGHYGSADTDGDGTDDYTGYIFNRAIYLPTSFDGTGITISYSANENGGTFAEPENGMILFEPSETLTSITVTFKSGETVVTSLTVTAMSGNVGLIATDASLAIDVTQDWYGGYIAINPIRNDEDEITGYTRSNDLQSDASSWDDDYDSITVSYELMNNTYGVYEIATSGDVQRVQVVAGKAPADYVQSVLLNAIFTFTEGETTTTEEIQIPIKYIDEDSSTNVAGFLPYYTYYSEMMNAKTLGGTVDTFTMPFCYGSGEPIICYDISGDTGGAISLYLTYGGTRVQLTLDGYESYTDALDAYLGATVTERKTKLDEIIASGDAEWEFNIDTDLILAQDSDITLTFNYKNTTADSGWYTYTSTAGFTLSGVLRYKDKSGAQNDEEIVKDEYLYKWMYDNFNPDSATYTVGGTDYTSKIVLTSWLSQNVAFDRSTDVTLQSVTDFAGMQYLKGTKNVNLSFITVSGGTATVNSLSSATCDTIAGYLAQMTSITELNLSGNNFRDKTSSDGTDNGTLSGLSALSNLRTLYLDNNAVYSFDWLLDIPSLEKVYVFKNISYGVDSIFYGSEGFTNLSVFQELTDGGVLVYNTCSGGTGYLVDASTLAALFSTTTTVMDYSNLCGIEYQNTLPTGADISLLYSTFSTDASYYSLSASYSYTISDGTSATLTPTSRTLAWGYVGDDPTTSTTFTLTYTLTASSTTAVIVIKYYITRI